MHRIAHAMLIVAGIIHLLPLAGLLGPHHLARLYGVVIADPDLIILMRHRAVLLALTGGWLIAGAWQPGLRRTACVAGLVSTVSFLALAWSAGGTNALLARVVVADVVALGCLLVALVLDQLTAAKNCRR